MFNVSKSTISFHISNILKDEELEENSVVRFFRTTGIDGKSYSIQYYNLDMVISYRLAFYIKLIINNIIKINEESPSNNLTMFYNAYFFV